MTTEYMIPTRPQYITFESTGTGDAKRYLDEKMTEEIENKTGETAENKWHNVHSRQRGLATTQLLPLKTKTCVFGIYI